ARARARLRAARGGRIGRGLGATLRVVSPAARRAGGWRLGSRPGRFAPGAPRARLGYPERVTEAPRSAFNPHLLALDCCACARVHDLSAPRAVCESCGRPLLARYDLERLRASWSRDHLARDGHDLWRYRAVL